MGEASTLPVFSQAAHESWQRSLEWIRTGGTMLAERNLLEAHASLKNDAEVAHYTIELSPEADGRLTAQQIRLLRAGGMLALQQSVVADSGDVSGVDTALRQALEHVSPYLLGEKGNKQTQKWVVREIGMSLLLQGASRLWGGYFTQYDPTDYAKPAIEQAGTVLRNRGVSQQDELAIWAALGLAAETRPGRHARRHKAMQWQMRAWRYGEPRSLEGAALIGLVYSALARK